MPKSVRFGEDVGNLPGHVVAAFLQLNHGSTVIASLPTCLLRSFKKSIRFLVFWTFLGAVPFTIT